MSRDVPVASVPLTASAYLDLVERLRAVADDIGSMQYPEIDGLLRNAADALDAIASAPEGGWYFSWKAADSDRQALNRAISDGPTWIPVSERLPEPQILNGKTASFVPVLFNAPEDAPRSVCSGRYFPATRNLAWESLQGERYPRESVTHWMPLPEAPK